MNMSKLIVELEKKVLYGVATNFTAVLREEANKVIPGIVGALAEKYGFDEEEAMGMLNEKPTIDIKRMGVTHSNEMAESNKHDTQMEESLPILLHEQVTTHTIHTNGQPTNGPADQDNVWVAQQQEGKEEPMKINNATSKATSQRNRGTGAGGANTNRNGLPYEELTSLTEHYTILYQDKFSYTIKFNDHSSNTFVIPIKKTLLFKTMGHDCNHDAKSMHGCKQPDECYIDKLRKIIFILEKKFQCTNGSVCEKIQTPEAKKWNFERKFPGYTIVYVYCLADYFKNKCEAELEYLEYKNVPVFWGSSENYKNDIIQFITNYK